MEPEMKTALKKSTLLTYPNIVRSLLVGAVLSLTACGGSSDDPEQSKSYVQFYNGAAASANPNVKLDDNNIGNARSADASNVVTLDTA